MAGADPLDINEILLRRVPPDRPGFQTTSTTSDGSKRPSSGTMKPRRNDVTQEVEVALSCSRLKLTSPAQLLQQLLQLPDPIDPAGWSVCWFRVADVLRIADGANGFLEVHAEPRTEPPADAGHCGIYGHGQQPCPSTDSAARKLAKIARILSAEQVASLQAGDSID
jgi:hypothetical protein